MVSSVRSGAERALAGIQAASRLIDRLCSAVVVVTSFLMVGLTVTVAYEIFSRYLFAMPLRYTDELSGLLFAWIVFLTVITVTKNGDNLQVTFVKSRLPRRAREFVTILSTGLLLVFSVYMLMASRHASAGVEVQAFAALGISRVWLYRSLTVAFAALCLVLTLQLLEYFASLLAGKPLQVKDQTEELPDLDETTQDHGFE